MSSCAVAKTTCEEAADGDYTPCPRAPCPAVVAARGRPSDPILRADRPVPGDHVPAHLLDPALRVHAHHRAVPYPVDLLPATPHGRQFSDGREGRAAGPTVLQ